MVLRKQTTKTSLNLFTCGTRAISALGLSVNVVKSRKELI